MKFNINNYEGKYAMHCKTEEEAKDFCRFLDSVGRTWCDSGSYLYNTNYRVYKGDTAYAFNIGEYCYIGYYRSKNYTILEWSDFMNKEFTKADLKTGDVVLRRNGSIEIVNRELEMLICSNGGWNDLDDIQDDLIHKEDMDEWDVIEVRRPTTKSDCCFNSMKYDKHDGDLVYERKEVEEMTLAEVCRLLGKEVKIVK